MSAKPELPKGLTQEQQIQLAMGISLSWWASLESRLLLLYRYCSDDVRIANDVWADASTKGFKERLRVCNSILKSKMPDPSLGIWNRLYDQIMTASDRRNEIAHSTIMNVEGKEMMLEPYFTMDASRQKQRLSVNDLYESAERFFDLSRAVEWLYVDLSSSEDSKIMMGDWRPTLIKELQQKIKRDVFKMWLMF